MSAELFTDYQNRGSDSHEELGKFIANVHKRTNGARLDIVPSKLELAYIQKHGEIKEHVLRDFVLDIEDQYDIIIIDCPPTDSVITNTAYLASDYLLVPVRPEFLSTIGLPLLAKALGEHKRLFRKERAPRVAGIVFNDVMASTEHARSKRHVSDVAKRLGWHVFGASISHSSSYPVGARVNKPIFLTDYARWDKRFEFEAFADEFAERIGL